MYIPDATDRRILGILQQDAKANIKELADALNMTKSPIYERIKRLEEEGIIKRYVAQLDGSRLESMMVVFCFVSLESQKLEAIEKFGEDVKKLDDVVECYLLGGSNDFLLKVIVKDLDAYHQFSAGKLAALSNVAQIKSSFVLNEIKHSNVFPVLKD